MTAEGLTSSRIANKLSISPRTVELYRSRMMKKLGLHNQVDVFDMLSSEVYFRWMID